MVPISAKEGTNVDQLLEMIDLQAQLMDLEADVAGPAKGYVLESKLEKGRGAVTTSFSPVFSWSPFFCRFSTLPVLTRVWISPVWAMPLTEPAWKPFSVFPPRWSFSAFPVLPPT